MELEITDQLSALAHPGRLALFRLLVRRYPGGVPAGEIAAALGLKANTASSYLSSLRQAGLITQRRVGTSLSYTASLSAVRSMFDHLISDCCQNRPDVCLPQFASTVPNPQPDQPLNVLFICTGNSARSIMAETLLKSLGSDRFTAFSAGSRPEDTPNTSVLDLLSRKGHDITQLASKSLDVFAAAGAPDMDFIFTVCDRAANEECPTWPGHPMSAHWGLPDPLRVSGSEAEQNLALQHTYQMLKHRIAAFVALPFETLDRLSLQHRLDDIDSDTLTTPSLES